MKQWIMQHAIAATNHRKVNQGSAHSPTIGVAPKMHKNRQERREHEEQSNDAIVQQFIEHSVMDVAKSLQQSSLLSSLRPDYVHFRISTNPRYRILLDNLCSTRPHDFADICRNFIFP